MKYKLSKYLTYLSDKKVLFIILVTASFDCLLNQDIMLSCKLTSPDKLLYKYKNINLLK